MKFSHNWLNEYLHDTQNSQDLTNTLTLAGLEVNSIEPVVLGKVTNVVVGQIKIIDKHPCMSKLNICSVDILDNEYLNIVCDSVNIYKGMKVPVAQIGAVLPGNFKIRKLKFGAQDSFGIMCSEKELGLSDKKKDDVMDLPADAIVGQDINDYLNLNDNIIEIHLSPNRADCFSIYGIAREISAFTKSKLNAIEIIEPNRNIDDKKNIKISAPEACKRYYGCVIKNVNLNATTPLWMREKLRRSEISSISLFVDVTNYVMLLTGQPMHAFNFDKLIGSINIRFAINNEELTLLNKTKIKLNSNTLVVADDVKVLAVAGIVGGLDSSINNTTTNIFLESAHFVPEKISGKARAYNLSTQASHRFEIGVDPELTIKAMKLAIKLITDIAGGDVGPIHGEKKDVQETRIILSIVKLNSVLGTSFDIIYIIEVLQNLYMKVTQISNNEIQVTIPLYRFDISLPEDLIEEVARLHGYSNLPETMPKYEAKRVNISETRYHYLDLCNILVDRGYNESINYSFIDPKYDKFFFQNKGIKLQNPISQNKSVMIQSLIPGLLNTFKSNIHRQQNRIRIFEQGACFKLENDQRIQFNNIAGLAYGTLFNTNWLNNKKVDFFDIKADVQALCHNIVGNLEFKVCDDIIYLHPGQSAYVYTGNKKFGVIGVIHPSVLKKFKLKVQAPPIVFELNLDMLSKKDIVSFEKISKYPSVSRDISFLVDKNVLVGDIINSINALDISILRYVHIFDVYRSKDSNKKSITLSIIYQDSTQTLYDKIIVEITDKILEYLKSKFSIDQRIP